jgi:hypothetical protein
MSLEPPILTADVPQPVDFDLGNGIRIRSVSVKPLADDEMQITIYWQAERPVSADYSVAVHLVAQDPPLSEADLLDQADNLHPVEGFYPTSNWQPGEIVRDDYLITVPANSQPSAIRVGMYQFDAQEGFKNTPWFSMPLP